MDMKMSSQMYVAINGKLEVANYYNYNYGDSMVSRVRYGMEYIMKCIDNPIMMHGEVFRRYLDIDFDKKSLNISLDVIYNHVSSYDVFDWDTNDGKVFISVDTSTNEIKYCFTDNDNRLLNVDQYLNWDLDVQHWRTWDILGWDDHTRNVCSGNTNRIKKLAKLMTQEELDAFLKLGGERA